MEIAPGRILSERYRLIRPVGHGSQASVWVAEHLALTTNIAVKLIDPELAKKEAARERFRREATAAAQLRSAHVVQILDHGIDGDQPFIVMELLDGEDLFERLAHRTRLTLRETSRIVTQVARALTRAHAAGIIHRDLKPENIFLVPNEDDEVVKVLDFGVAKVTDPGKAAMQRTGLGTLIGTPHYMSPEQVKGISEIDSRADLWALGVIAYQCVTGELPFDSEGVGDLLIKISVGEIPVPSKLVPSLPPSFDAWFVRACARDPAERFQSAREVAVALAAVVSAIAEVPRAATMRPPGKLSAFPAPIPAAGAPAAKPAPAAPTPAPAPAPAAAAKAPSVPPRPAPKAAPYKPAWARAPAPSSEELDPNELESDDEDDEDNAPTRMKSSSDAVEHDIDFDEPEPELPRHPLLDQLGSAFAFSAATAAPGGRAGDSPSKPGSPPPRTTPRSTPALTPPAAAPAAPAPAPAPAAPPPSHQAMPPPAAPPPSRATPPRPKRDEVTGGLSASALVAMPATDTRPAAPARSSAPEPVRGSTVSGLSRSGMTPTDPPPELDGSRRRRMVRVLLAALVIGAVGVTWTVIRSQLSSSSPADPGPLPAIDTAPSAAPPAPPKPREEPPSSASAVDPGKVSRPLKPTPTSTFKPRPHGAKKPSDGTIEIPDGEETVPAAP